MPELPEVECLRRGLQLSLEQKTVIERAELRRPDIRFPVPKNITSALRGQEILAIRRRAKYLLFDTPKLILLSHLGMTGSWTELARGTQRGREPHDHFVLYFQDGRQWIFNDPRRFGIIDSIAPGKENRHKLLSHLGLEPLDVQNCTPEILKSMSSKSQTPIKSFLMDQTKLVGVGNIYVAEALFRAGIRPLRKASRVTLSEWEKLLAALREILDHAIHAGGSSIKDYRSLNKEAGSFQTAHLVYARDGKPCAICSKPLQLLSISGRSTVFCRKCQK